MAAKFFTGLPLDGPGPECVQGYGESALASPGRTVPAPGQDHSHRTRPRSTGGSTPVSVTIGERPSPEVPPVSPCAANPLAGFRVPEHP